VRKTTSARNLLMDRLVLKTEPVKAVADIKRILKTTKKIVPIMLNKILKLETCNVSAVQIICNSGKMNDMGYGLMLKIRNTRTRIVYNHSKYDTNSSQLTGTHPSSVDLDLSNLFIVRCIYV
jgi:hypothetical protein